MSSNFRRRFAARLLRIRPAPLAAVLKFLFCIRREVFTVATGRFWIDPASHFGSRLLLAGDYEPEMAAVLQRQLRPGDTFVDLGANEGYFTVKAAALVGPAGRVVAIEPQGRLQPVLQRNIALNAIPNATIVSRAISDHAGSARLHLASSMNTGSTSFLRPTKYALPRQTVAMSTLEQVFDELCIHSCRLLKIDIEGWEHEAVLGSPALFRSGRVQALAIEMHPHLIAPRGLDPAAVPVFLRQCGYRQNSAEPLEWNRAS